MQSFRTWKNRFSAGNPGQTSLVNTLTARISRCVETPAKADRQAATQLLLPGNSGISCWRSSRPGVCLMGIGPHACFTENRRDGAFVYIGMTQSKT